MWFLTRIYKNKLKELEKNNKTVSNDKLLNSIYSGRVKKLKYTLRIINILRALTMLIIIVVIMVLLSLAFNFTSTFTTITGNAIINMFNGIGSDDEEEDEDGWSWDKGTGSVGGGSNLQGSGGLYPKDTKLRLRAELLEVLAKSAEDAQKETGNKLEPAWVLGTIYRETGNSMYNALNNSKTSSLFKDLIVMNPICGKGSCIYVGSNHSHYLGGVIVEGVDKGDPHKHVINTDIGLYQQMGGDHAIGYIQFEIPYIYGTMNKIYSNPTPVLTSTDPASVQAQSKMDKDLGFIRPNPLYIPDAMYNGAFRLARTPTITSSDYTNIIQSSEFKKLSEYNQNFIKFVYASAGYGRGNITSSDDEMARALITLGNSGKIEFLDDLVLSQSSVYWDSTTMSSLGNKTTFSNYVNATYGLNMSVDRVAWYGVYSAAVGKVAYVEMQKAIAAAEKEGGGTGTNGASNGNWLGKPGSGKFGNNGSKYYSEEIGMRWYNQTSQVNNNSETWGSLFLAPSSDMATGGCGIYTLAMIASNLYNKDVTPDVVLAALEGNYQLDCLTDAGVNYLIPKLGLQGKTLNFYSKDIIQQIYDSLDKGNMILFVSQAYNASEFPWYYGEGHFMAIRGKTDDGKLLVVSSIGNYRAGLDGPGVANTPLAPETFLKYLSKNRNYVWEVGINVQ